MRTVAVSMVRDEEDIVWPTVAHMLTQVDHVIVADNLSVDSTRLRLESLASTGRLTIVEDRDPAYRQSEKMTALAQRARLTENAEWIVPFDADEVWTAGDRRIADVLAELDPHCLVTPAHIYDHVATGLDNNCMTNPIARMPWRRTEPNPLHKVACRWRNDLTIEQGNHAATYDTAASLVESGIIIHHYPIRSVAQLVTKVRNGSAAYAAAGDTLPPGYGAHWRQWGAMLDAHGEPAIAELFETWYYRPDPTVPHQLPNGEVAAPLINDTPHTSA